MNRRDLLLASLAVGGAAVAKAATPTALPMQGDEAPMTLAPLTPPVDADIRVAFLISDGAVVIDFAGPWEVFSDVTVPGRRNAHPFDLYTVAESMSPIRAAGGMMLVPNHSLATAPRPNVLVVPAQGEPSAAMLAWLRDMSHTTDVTMSVCTGAFVLAKAGLLSGKPATTHHNAYAELAAEFPDIAVRRGARFVEAGNTASAGGLSSGIDLALHVVARYFGADIAARTADTMEYQGLGWRDSNANQAYAARRVSTAQHPLCPVCEMSADTAAAPRSVYHGRTYLFCSDAHKVVFDAQPDRFATG